VKFVHRSIDTSDAALLGAKSLREQLFAGDDIMCPEPAEVQAMVANDAVTDTLTDLLALADILGAEGIHVRVATTTMSLLNTAVTSVTFQMSLLTTITYCVIQKALDGRDFH
jgi:hypothetical protein